METASDVREEEFLWQSRDAGASPKEFQAGTCPPPLPCRKNFRRFAAQRMIRVWLQGACCFFPAEADIL